MEGSWSLEVRGMSDGGQLEVRRLSGIAGPHLYPVVVVVEQQQSRSGHLLCLHHRFQVGQQAHVLRHVRRQHLQDNAEWSDRYY